MSRRARQEASLNYTNVTFAFLALAMMAVAGIMPYWQTFVADYSFNWPMRQWGLLKVSGKYTNVVLTGADITWIQLRDTVCGASAAWTASGAGASAVGMASALGNAVTGITCSTTCKTHIANRCTKYYQVTYLNLGVFGGLMAGALITLTGSAMPLLGKERKKDRTTWLAIDILGFILCAGCLVGYYFYYESMLYSFRTTSYFKMNSLGWAFYMACGGAVMLLFPAIIQGYKIASSQEKKPDTAPLLTAGATPDFLMPSAI